MTPLLHLLVAAGQIAGTVVHGDAPVPKKIEPTVDTAICSQQNLVDESLLVDPKTKGVKNVAAWVQGVKVKHELADVTLDNVGCRYEPHVVILRKGQSFTVRNGDRFLHTTQAKDAKGKTVFNVAFPGKGDEQKKKIDKPGVFSLVCDVHTWMKAWAVVLEDQPAALSDGEGRFTISNVPAGKRTIELWHETLGKKTVPVEVKDGETTQVRIEW